MYLHTVYDKDRSKAKHCSKKLFNQLHGQYSVADCEVIVIGTGFEESIVS